MRHKWLAFFLILWVLIFAGGVYSFYYPNPAFNLFNLNPTPLTTEETESMLSITFVSALLEAAVIVIVVRVLYVGLKRLFSPAPTCRRAA